MALNLDKYFAGNNNKSNSKRRTETPRKSQQFTGLRTDPTYTVVLVDESGSMSNYVDQVVEGYEIMLDNFRKSAVTKKDAHYITLAVFAEEYNVLQEVEKLSPVKSKDNVMKLCAGQNYNPVGMTALYECLYNALWDILNVMKDMEAQGVHPRLNIALISDGDDTMNGDPQKVRNIVLKLKKEEYLARANVLGLLDKKFTKEKLEEIRSNLGFDMAIPLDKSAKDFRRAFLMASTIS